ncbi:hypothetical protein FQN54_003295 [Arachnomyces sp. PD_36]|nr:hypothetical protein FQN54_003295 [Arachnomyces sp. PD_36]
MAPGEGKNSPIEELKATFSDDAEIPNRWREEGTKEANERVNNASPEVEKRGSCVTVELDQMYRPESSIVNLPGYQEL